MGLASVVYWGSQEGVGAGVEKEGPVSEDSCVSEAEGDV